MNSKKVIIIVTIVALVILLVLSILLVTLMGKKDNSKNDVAVENSVSTNEKEKDNTSKTKDDDDDDDDDDEDENASNTNKVRNESKTNNRTKDTNTNTNTTNTSNRNENNENTNTYYFDDKDLDELERMTFNSKFDKYKGKQRGSNVSSLLMSLKANSQTQEDNNAHLPYIIYINSNGEYFEETTDVSIIEEDIGEIETVHSYYVDVAENEDTGLIHGIVISYDSNDDIKEDIENLAKKIANK